VGQHCEWAYGMLSWGGREGREAACCGTVARPDLPLLAAAWSMEITHETTGKVFSEAKAQLQRFTACLQD